MKILNRILAFLSINSSILQIPIQLVGLKARVRAAINLIEEIMINATQIRVGQILKIDNIFFRVLKVQHITPGKGNAVIQTEVRNLKTKNKDNIRFRSSETVEQVDVTIKNVTFLYQEESIFHFMDPKTFDQIEISKDVLDDAVKFLIPETPLVVSLIDDNPVSVDLPPKLTYEVTECDPPTKGAAGAFKEAKLVNDIVIKVPLFIKQGDLVVIDTETCNYSEKG